MTVEIIHIGKKLKKKKDWIGQVKGTVKGLGTMKFVKQHIP